MVISLIVSAKPHSLTKIFYKLKKAGQPINLFGKKNRRHSQNPSRHMPPRKPSYATSHHTAARTVIVDRMPLLSFF